MTPAWTEALLRGAAALGIPLDASTGARLSTFADRLLEWGAKIDLTSIKDPDEIRKKHFLDSIAGLAFLRPTDRRIADIGSGGGFPGVVLAIVDPTRHVVSIESRSKKAVFQRQVGRELGLTNLEVLAERVEDVKTAPPDLVTARALADLDSLVELTKPWLAIGAGLLAWKSSRVDAELEAAAKRMAAVGVEVLERKDFTLPESNEPRTLLRVGRKP